MVQKVYPNVTPRVLPKLQFHKMRLGEVFRPFLKRSLIRLTNGKENSSKKHPVDCTTPDKFEYSKLGSCKSLRFNPKSKITGKVSYYNNGNNGWHGDWIKLISNNGIIFKCQIAGWIDGNDGSVPTSRNFTCKFNV